MKLLYVISTALAACVALPLPGAAGQAPRSASDADVPITREDRVYAAEQFSNTVSVIDPVDNSLIGSIKLGDPQPANLSPLYKGQLLVHGLRFAPDGKTLAAVSVGSNSVTFIDTDFSPLVGASWPCSTRDSRRCCRRR